MIYLQLFICFLQVGMFSIGGGYAAIGLIQSLVVEQRGWITMQEFLDLITIAEMTPGPITVNSATFVGIAVAGTPGAIAATLGCIFPALFLVTLLAYIYDRYKDLSILQSILASLRPAVVALIASAGVSILLEVLFAGEAMMLSNLNWIGGILFLAGFLVIRKLKWSPILVMCVCGICNLVINTLLH
ncbi:MAG: chromate transporter [Erysipelotrichaceae bacterium]|nr:chromate transporter [Erysipelotrichaceae bacterium]MBQ9987751.1 chromate transporter [Erysipelotrichales bacterium]MBR3693630.1 chromate transporter [Erysipelotrichales bacterium]